ncbi:MAG: cache domain-containing protein, partial [Pseudomonadota bacterium]
MNLSRILPIIAILFSALPLAALIVLSSWSIKDSYKEQAAAAMTQIVRSNVKAVEHYLETVKQDIAYQSRTNLFIKAYADLTSGIDSSDLEAVKSIYLEDDTDRGEILIGNGEQIYEFMHEAHHAVIKNLLAQTPYSDIALLSPDGLVIYSVRKGDAFGSVVSSSSDIPESRRYANAIAQTPADSVFVSEFVGISEQDRSAILSTPLASGGKPMGYLIATLDADRLSARLDTYDMLGASGIVSLLNADFQPIASSTQTGLDATISVKGPAQESESLAVTDLAGRQIYYALRPLPNRAGSYFVVARQDTQEIYAPANGLLATLMWIAACVLIVSGLLIYLIFKRAFLPLRAVSETISEISAGNLKADRPSPSRFQEIRQISSALDSLVDSRHAQERLNAQTIEEQKAKEVRQDQVHA